MTEVIIKTKQNEGQDPGAEAWIERGMNGKLKYGLKVNGDNVDDALNKLNDGWLKLNRKYNDQLKAFNDAAPDQAAQGSGGAKP